MEPEERAMEMLEIERAMEMVMEMLLLAQFHRLFIQSLIALI